MDAHFDVVLLEPLNKRTIGSHEDERVPATRVQTRSQRSQLQVRAIQAGRRVQEEDAIRNGSRRDA